MKESILEINSDVLSALVNKSSNLNSEQKNQIFNTGVNEFGPVIQLNNLQIKGDEPSIFDRFNIQNFEFGKNFIVPYVKFTKACNNIKIYGKIGVLEFHENCNDIIIEEGSEIEVLKFHKNCGKIKNEGKIYRLELFKDSKAIRNSGYINTAQVWGNAISYVCVGETTSLLIHEESIVESIINRNEISGITVRGTTYNIRIEEKGISTEVKIEGESGNLFINGIIERNLIISGICQDINLVGTVDSIGISGDIQNLKVYKKSKCGEIKTTSSSKCKDISIEGSVGLLKQYGVARDLNIRESSDVKKIYLKGSNKDVFIVKSISEIEINGISERFEIKDSILSALTLTEPIISNLLIESSIIQDCYISKTKSESIYILIDESEFENLHIKNTILRDGDCLILQQCKPKNIILDNINNQGTLSINSLQPYYRNKPSAETEVTSFSILESNLGAAQFINCDFSKFNEFTFYNSNILNSFMGGCTIPEYQNIIVPNNKQLHGNEDQKRLYYSQLKSLYERQGDFARSGEARAFEMNAYRDYLINKKRVETKRRKFTIPKKRKINLWDIRKDQFVLFLNKYSSYYGTNWIRAVTMTIIVTISSFSIYILMIGYRPTWPWFGDWNRFLELSSHSLSYLNPFRDEDTVQLLDVIKNDINSGYLSRDFIHGRPCHIINPIARIWDYISRIFVAFMVYQTIAAFRRLGRGK